MNLFKTRALLGAVLAQAAVIIAVWYQAYVPSDPVPGSDWRKIQLAVVPVDPRSLFQGNYVRLNFAVSRVPADLGDESMAGAKPGDRVYVTLAEERGTWNATAIGLRRPAEGRTFLRGVLKSAQSGYQVHYGIEAYYTTVKNALGHEGALRDARAEVVVHRNGRAGLVTLQSDFNRPAN